MNLSKCTFYEALVFILIICSSWPAQQRGFKLSNHIVNEKRIALTIGNANYSEAPLKNPTNDASAMAVTLKSLGFEVYECYDKNQIEMKRAIRLFGENLVPGGIALFYYSGHGIQSGGNNFLIPISADIKKEGDIALEAVDINYVLNEMESAKSRVNIVILDACRNNPIPRIFRSSKSGLAQIEAPSGTVIAYSTSPGSVASDGDGNYGLYTQELLDNIKIPNIPIETVFKRTLKAVREKSNGSQLPWTSYSIEGDFVFNDFQSEPIKQIEAKVNKASSENQPITVRQNHSNTDSTIKQNNSPIQNDDSFTLTAVAYSIFDHIVLVVKRLLVGVKYTILAILIIILLNGIGTFPIPAPIIITLLSKFQIDENGKYFINPFDFKSSRSMLLISVNIGVIFLWCWLVLDIIPNSLSSAITTITFASTWNILRYIPPAYIILNVWNTIQIRKVTNRIVWEAKKQLLNYYSKSKFNRMASWETIRILWSKIIFFVLWDYLFLGVMFPSSYF